MSEILEILELLLPSLGETVYMVIVSTIFTVLLGFPLGVLLVITEKDHILPKPMLNSVLSYIVNIIRSMPFLILMVAIFPFTKLIVGSSIGTTAAIVPLTIAATPFFARIVETSLKEISPGIIEASIAMGATPMEIILKVLLPEALPSLVLGVTITIINILGYSAMAGTVGGGGLGDLAIRYGYHRFQTKVMVSTVIVLIIIVQATQSVGNKLSNILNKK